MFEYIAPFIGPILAGIGAGVGVYVATSNRLAVLETKMDDLRDKVEKHNSMIERTYKLECDEDTQWKRIDEMRETLNRISSEHDRYGCIPGGRVK